MRSLRRIARSLRRLVSRELVAASAIKRRPARAAAERSAAEGASSPSEFTGLRNVTASFTGVATSSARSVNMTSGWRCASSNCQHLLSPAATHCHPLPLASHCYHWHISTRCTALFCKRVIIGSQQHQKLECLETVLETDSLSLRQPMVTLMHPWDRQSIWIASDIATFEQSFGQSLYDCISFTVFACWWEWKRDVESMAHTVIACIDYMWPTASARCNE